jgi:hypothetical protein
MKNEKIIDTFVENGILFEVINKPEMIFAGKIGYALNLNEEPNIGSLLDGYRGIMEKIIEAVEPEWWLGISIDYGKPDALSGYMFATEVRTDKQPVGVDVYKVPSTNYIRLRKDNKSSLKLLGKESCQTFELFFPMFDIMKKHGYMHADNGAQEMECDYSKDMSISFAYVAVEGRK